VESRSSTQFAQDIRYGLRQLRKSPGFAATAIVTLALGIGANTTVFSLIYGLMLSSLPVPHPEQLIRYRLAPLPTNPSYSAFFSLYLSEMGVLNGPMGESIRRHESACSDIFSWKTVDALTCGQGGQSEFITGALVSGSTFAVLGLKPQLGRLLDESDDRPGGATGGWQADISYAFWQREFHGDRTAIGRELTVDQVPVTIAGVLPRNFDGVIIGASPDIILPLEIDSVFAAARGRPSIRENKFSTQVAVMGRLKPGVTTQQARANAQAIQEGMFDDAMPAAVRYNPFATTQCLDVTSASAGWSFYRPAYEKPLLIVQSLVAVILALIAANLAGLLLARSASRRQELEIRAALGASRLRLTRQLLTETALLAGIGIPLGCLFAWRASHLAAGFLASPGTALEIDRWHNPAVLAFAAVSGLLTALVAGIPPAMIVTRPLRAATLAAGGRQSYSSRHSRLGSTLIPVQVALSLVLVAIAGLFGTSLARLLTTPSGMRDQGVFFGRTNIEHRPEKGEQADALYARMLDHLSNQPGVQSASLVLSRPMRDQAGHSYLVTPASKSEVRENNFHCMNAVGCGFFKTLGIAILAGRDFAPTDKATSQEVCILNQSASRLFFPDGNALGGEVNAPQEVDRLKAASYQVVGIVADAKYETLSEDPPATVYIPYTQHPDPVSPTAEVPSPHKDMSFVIKGDDGTLLSSIYRDTLSEFVPDTPVYSLTSLHQLMLNSIASSRMIASLSEFLGLLALLLTSVALYGQVSWSVTERTSEIGIRMALGATRRNVVTMIVCGLVIPTGIGAAAGLAGVLGASRLIGSWLYNTRPASPALILGSVGCLLVVAAIASLLPARRAASIDPMQCLRAE
jgi:predicted permease